MNKKLTILCSLMILFLFSCRKDNNSSMNASQNDLTGTWKVEKMVIGGTVTPSAIPVPVPFSQVRETDCVKQSKLVLNEDGSGMLMVKDDFTGSCMELFNNNFNYTYNEAENQIVVSVNNVNESVTLHELTSDTMVAIKQIESYNIEQGSFTGTATLFLKK